MSEIIVTADELFGPGRTPGPVERRPPASDGQDFGPDAPMDEEEPLPEEEGMEPGGGEEDLLPGEGNPDIESQIESLQQDLSDDKLQVLSEKVTSLAMLVGDGADKLIDAYSDYMEAAMSLKAQLNAAKMVSLPARMQQQKMQEALQPLLDQVQQQPYAPVT